MSVEVENLTKNYGLQKAVDNISFDVKTGEVVGFLGPNGAGKSTTMKIITCFMAPDAGDIRLEGISVRNDPDSIKARIGYLPENNPLYEDMAIIDYLRFCGEINGMNRNEIPGRIKEMIEICGLERERHKKIHELSKGYRQRVGLAQAMIHNPEILILDEPTSGLDPNQIVEIRNLIKELGKEKTVILSSHILSEVEATCDRILIINKGKIVADGTAETLRHQSKGQELLTVTIEGGEKNEIVEALRNVSSIEKVLNVEGYPEKVRIQSKPEKSSKREIFDMCVERKWYLTELTAEETRLEDVFRKLTN